MRSYSTDALLRLPQLLYGRPAVYVGGSSIVHIVLLADVRVRGELLELTCTSIPTQGLPSFSKPLHLAASGEILTVLGVAAEVPISASYVSATYVQLVLYLNPAVVAEVTRIVSVMDAGQTYLDDYTSRLPTIQRPEAKHKIVAIKSPGATASALLAYLHDQQFSEHHNFKSLLAIPDAKN